MIPFRVERKKGAGKAINHFPVEVVDAPEIVGMSRLKRRFQTWKLGLKTRNFSLKKPRIL